MAQNPVTSSNASDVEQRKLLEILVRSSSLSADDLKSLLVAMDNFDVVAKVFLLEGVPFVFSGSPMKYLIFREQVADRFEIGYQDVCIVGSAKLGFSPSPHKFGQPFAVTSDVDVVVISSDMFDRGTRELFQHLNHVGPPLDFQNAKPVTVESREWRLHREAVRNFVYENFNPSHLPEGHFLRSQIFSNIASTSALFLALEPQVFVSKIRCRIFRHWRAAEAYYVNTLRQLKKQLGSNDKFRPASGEIDFDEDDPVAATTA
ncbi:hypothetical protein [Oharaeibacter diazotrophicus]|uniref:hypothetical protein n=1 Tax=Oharaeibacter diazotrophicus TaxID=1920512 RepID=UPI000F817687|nr:hypothetical protein [Oharaeibacter diazotrophicus]